MSFSANLNFYLSAAAASAPDIGSASYSINESLVLAALATGSGINQANQVWADRRTLTTASSENLSMKAPAAADGIGQTLALTTIKALYIKNRSVTVGDILYLGGEASADAWNSPFAASDTAKLTLQPGGSLIIVAPSAAGYVVADPGNYKLKIENPGANSIDYDLILIGS